MKSVSCYLFLLCILKFGCAEENVNKIQNLEDGEFVIELYNNKGDLLLTKEGNAENLGTPGNRWEIRLLDPAFELQNSDPLKTFASLTMFGQSSINIPQELRFNTNNTAYLYQRWYSLEGDWGYKSTNGTLSITSAEKSIVKGSFEISLEADANTQQNPLWGAHILVKGYFSSTCPYQNVGGCP